MIYDVAIIGGGPGGYTAAFRAREQGLSVILFEYDRIGGTCLNRGCVPTKYLAHVAELNRQLSEMNVYGIQVERGNIDFQQTQMRNYEIVSTLREGLSEQMEAAGIEIVRGNARLNKDKTLSCNGQFYQALDFIIATGSVPNTAIGKNAITSNEALIIEKIPASVSIIGGGVIAVELAEIFQGLGSNVDIYIRGDKILRKWDKDIAQGLTQSMKKRSITIHTKCKKEELESVEDELVISALGRIPVVDSIDSALYQIGPSGGIIVDEVGFTGIENVYAIGDVVEESPMLAHTAMEQGKRVVDYIANGIKREKATVINCIYTSPEVASVGMTELEAKEKGILAVVGKQTMYSNARTMIATKERGFVKIIADVVSGKILGAQFLCERATDLIVEVAEAIDNQETVSQMLLTTRPHPGFSEAITEALEIIQRKMKNEI